MNPILHRPLVLLFILLGTVSLTSAQTPTWERYGPFGAFRFAAAVELPNGQIVSGEYTEGNGQLIRYDAQGNVLATKPTPAFPWLDMAVTTNNRVAGAWARAEFGSNYIDSSGVTILDGAGNPLYGFAFMDTVDGLAAEYFQLHPDSDGGLLATFTSQTQKGPPLGSYQALNRILRLDSVGNPVFFIPHPYPNYDRFITAAGLTNDNLQFVAGLMASPFPFIYSTSLSSTNGIYLQKLGATGQTIFDQQFYMTSPAHLGAAVQTADDGYLLALDYLPGGNGLRLMKCDDQGDSLWTTPMLKAGVRARDMAAMPDSGAVVVGNIRQSAGNMNHAYISRWDKNGALMWENEILPLGFRLTAVKVDVLDNGGYLVSGDVDSTNTWVAKLDSVGGLEEYIISGQAYVDVNSNCVFDGTDAPWVHGAITTTSYPFVTYTDSSGDYAFKTVPGTQYVSLDLPNYIQIHQPVSNCPNPLDSIPVVVTSANPLVSGVDFAFEIGTQCPMVNVQQSGFFPVRPCSTSVAQLQITNYTSTTINNPYVLVTLDTLLTLDSASVPFTALGNNVFRFDFASLSPIGLPGYFIPFLLHTTVDCNALIGEAVCTVVEGFPQDTCAQSSLWSGALVDVTGECTDDSLMFLVENVGTANMAGTTGILIAEDDILKYHFSVQFNQGQDTLIKIPGNGKTWTVIAQQEVNSPYGGRVWSAIEGCDTLANGGYSVGHVTTTLPAQADPFYSVSCQEVRNSYDPNDKRGTPFGVGNDQLIAIGERLEYMIRFQNTGNDPAYRVVIRDELPPELDPSSVLVGLSSHPFTFQMLPDQTLEWTFDPIVLPDSASDPDGSQGYVMFQVDQMPGNMPGTVIRNAAEIYFDFNPAIITDTSVHTVEELDNVLLFVDAPLPQQPQILAWPNPTRDIVNIRPEEGLYASMQLEVFDVQGRMVAARKVVGEETISLNVQQWSPGIYIFRLQSEGLPLGQGRIWVR